jgi:EmrB/QacA subfamily drug resistance transporter
LTEVETRPVGTAEPSFAGAGTVRIGSRGSVLAVILVAYLMIVIDSSIVVTALPQLRDALGMNEAELSWVQNAYLLAHGGFLLPGARAGDLFGRRRMFTLSVGVFTAASFAVGTAPSAPWLLIARATQGLGAAVLAPSALSLLQTSFPEPDERTKAVAYHSAVAGVGAMLGLILGGAFTAWISWRIGFLINVPIGVALIALTPRHVSETERHAADLDLLGAISSTLGMVALVFGLVRVANSSWRVPWTLGALVVGVGLLVVFVASEARAKQPIMPLRLLANRERSAAYVARLLLVGAIVGFLFFMTLYLQRVLMFSPFSTGLAFLPMMIANFGGAIAFPRLTRRLGSRQLLVATLGTTLAGMAWLSRLSPGASYLTNAALPMVLIGAGGGGSVAPLTALGIAGVQPSDAGAASGLVNVAHQIGGSLGLAALLVVFASSSSAPSDMKEALAHRVAAALQGGTVLTALALTTVLFFIARAPAPSSPDAAQRQP